MAKLSVFTSIAFALVALLMIAEAKLTDERIFEGQRTTRGQFPHQVSVCGPKYHFVWHFCGGVLISDRFVLTTANCTQGLHSHAQKVTVVVGLNTMSPSPHHSGTPYNVSRITNHPKFDRKTMANDISVIKTVRKIGFTDLVKPARLPTSNVADGAAATISGWGRFDNSGEYWSTRLRYQHTNVIARSHCISRLGNLGNRIHENTICTKNSHGQGICVGDFGGPLIERGGNVLIGLASWTKKCGSGLPDVYTRVFSHLKFIQIAMGQ